MIVSHSRKFVFVAIPKTASQTVRSVLQPLLSANDWQQEALFQKRSFPIPSLAQIGHGHLTVADVLPYLEHPESYRFFAVVRNPFDRFVSTVFFRQKNNETFQQDPAKYLNTLSRSPILQTDTWFQPQSRFLAHSGQHRVKTEVIRFENLAVELPRLFERLVDRPMDQPVPRLNASSHPHYSTYYAKNAELTSRIAKAYAQDFEQFRYGPNIP